MCNIALVCSLHNEHGKCNSNELYKIIETINPEILFEEMTPSLFAAIYRDCRGSNLESVAINKYLQKHQITHIPVDRYEPTKADKNQFNWMFNVIDNNNEYIEIQNRNVLLACQYGFEYLNSNQCNEIIGKQQLIEETIINKVNDAMLLRIYEQWKGIHDKRENEMLNNIYSYAKEHPFSRGLFIIGAAHRKSIINKLQNYNGEEGLKLKWDINLPV